MEKKRIKLKTSLSMSTKLMIGARAIHPVYGICEIIEVYGSKRTILVISTGNSKMRLEVRNISVDNLTELTAIEETSEV